MKNLIIVSKSEGDNYYERNVDIYNKETIDNKIIDLIIFLGKLNWIGLVQKRV